MKKLTHKHISIISLLLMVLMIPLSLKAITLPGSKNDIKNRMMSADLIVLGNVVPNGSVGLNIKVTQILKGDKSYLGKVLMIREPRSIGCGTGQPDYPVPNTELVVMFKHLYFSAYYDEINFTEKENIELKKTLSQQMESNLKE